MSRHKARCTPSVETRARARRPKQHSEIANGSRRSRRRDVRAPETVPQYSEAEICEALDIVAAAKRRYEESLEQQADLWPGLSDRGSSARSTPQRPHLH